MPELKDKPKQLRTLLLFPTLLASPFLVKESKAGLDMVYGQEETRMMGWGEMRMMCQDKMRMKGQDEMRMMWVWMR